MKPSLIAFIACCAVGSVAVARNGIPTTHPQTSPFTDIPVVFPPQAARHDIPVVFPPQATRHDIPVVFPPQATLFANDSSMPTFH